MVFGMLSRALPLSASLHLCGSHSIAWCSCRTLIVLTGFYHNNNLDCAMCLGPRTATGMRAAVIIAIIGYFISNKSDILFIKLNYCMNERWLLFAFELCEWEKLYYIVSAAIDIIYGQLNLYFSFFSLLFSPVAADHMIHARLGFQWYHFYAHINLKPSFVFNYAAKLWMAAGKFKCHTDVCHWYRGASIDRIERCVSFIRLQYRVKIE